ncbi:hypothetical protein ABZP36_032839 [Zizania latifolia]
MSGKMLGKRQRSQATMRRTTSVASVPSAAKQGRHAAGGEEHAPSASLPAGSVGIGAGGGLAVQRAGPGDHARVETAAFLKNCGLCNVALGPGKDTYIYRQADHRLLCCFLFVLAWDCPVKFSFHASIFPFSSFPVFFMIEIQAISYAALRCEFCSSVGSFSTGEVAFCSQECRERLIEYHERGEQNCSLISIKDTPSVSGASGSDQSGSGAGETVAAA